MPKKPIKS